MWHQEDDFDNILNDIANEESEARKNENSKENKTRRSLIDELLNEIEAAKKLDSNQKSNIFQTKTEAKGTFDKEIEAISSFVFNNKSSNQQEAEEDELDPEDVIRELEEREEESSKLNERLEQVLIKNKKAVQLPLIVLKKDKKYSSHEMVQEQLKFFENIKNTLYTEIPSTNLFKAKAISDFDPSLIYSSDEAKTMLKFTKNSVIVIMAAFTSEWLLGFLVEDQKVRIFPMMMVIPIYDELLCPERIYEIRYWSLFGLNAGKAEDPLTKSLVSDKQVGETKVEGKIEEKDKQKDIQNHLQTINAQTFISKSIGIDHLFMEKKVKPKLIYQAIKDFNYTGPEEKLWKNINLISLRKGDLVAMTKLPNEAGWSEGFVLNKKDVVLGIFNVVFTTLIKLKVA